MTNEEHVEEMYHMAYDSGVLPEFQKEVSKQLNNNPGLHRYDIVYKVFYSFVNEGMIESVEVN